MKEEITKALAKLSKDRATQEYISEKLVSEEKSLIFLKRNANDFLEVRALFQKAAQDTQQKLEFHISNLVSTALAAIWDDPYIFQLEFVQKRNKTEAELWFVRNGEKMKPIDASGGGPVDIASLALRIAFWSLTKKTRPLFIIDEPFRNLSSDLQSRASDMLQMLSKNLGLQLIIVSHIDQLIQGADKEFKIALKSGVSICQG